MDVDVGGDEVTLRGQHKRVYADFSAVTLQKALVDIFDQERHPTELLYLQLLRDLLQLDEVDALLVVDMELVDALRVKYL